MKRPSLYPYVIALSLASSVVSFQSSPVRTSQSPSSSQLYIVGVETIGIAVVSAAAGAATQIPRIQELEGELVQARAALEKSKGDMVTKINELEEKLFQMDKAYEEQSAKFMKEYEQRKNEEVQKITEKIKTDFAYKLDIEVEKEKSRLLAQKLSDVKVSGDQTTKLAEMRIKMDMLESAKEKLEIALQKSEAELKRLDKAGKAKNAFWPF
jgi:hypothetical protein